MTTIRINKRLDSETMTLPQLRPLVGKDVEIIVRERVPMSEEQVAAFFEAGKHIKVDLDAIMALREASKL
jgi:hypothetical protein